MTLSARAGSVVDGLPSVAQRQRLEVDVGVPLPSAFSGLRKLLLSVQSVAPAAVQRLAASRPAEWNRLFPGSIAGAKDLSDLALTPSERRLHRESEQVFWILNLAARALLEGLRESDRTLVVHGAGECDLVSLRALMRAAEWARLEGLDGRIHFAPTRVGHVQGSTLFADRRAAYLATLCERMRVPALENLGGPLARPLEPSVDLEGSYLSHCRDPAQAPESRIAAAVLALRACFFTSNYEGALLAAEQGLAQLNALGAALSPSQVLSAWDALDTGFTTPAIEVDKESLGDGHELRALFERSLGVVQVFTGEHDAALASFGRGLECGVSPERKGQLRMFRALTLIKRYGQLPRAREEIQQGLAGLEGRETSFRSLHEGWLRNVSALTYFQEKKLNLALQEEKQAMRCVGDLHDASATHLKINLISNASVLQETAQQFTEAIATWQRFEKVSANWGENFHKHHRYRLAGLQLFQGERDSAVQNYTEAYQWAERLGDPLHRQVIAAELGALMLSEGHREKAAEWYSQSLDHAREIGDPFKVGESLAGQSLATGTHDFGAALQAVEQSSTYPSAQKTLAAALRGTDAAQVQAVLPKPRSKLNRPFDLVNL